jgi:hypothetical protein
MKAMMMKGVAAALTPFAKCTPNRAEITETSWFTGRATAGSGSQ